MKLYSCKIRCQGDIRDEVRRLDVTGAEITLLRHLHGADAVIEIRQTGDVDRDEDEERHRLGKVYAEKVVIGLYGAPKPKISDEIADAVDAEPEEPVRPTMQTARRTSSVAKQAGIAALE
jgi:hypothetical protein